jgi:hypothetical protein
MHHHFSTYATIRFRVHFPVADSPSDEGFSSLPTSDAVRATLEKSLRKRSTETGHRISGTVSTLDQLQTRAPSPNGTTFVTQKLLIYAGDGVSFQSDGLPDRGRRDPDETMIWHRLYQIAKEVLSEHKRISYVMLYVNDEVKVFTP